MDAHIHDAARITSYAHEGLRFDVRDEGPLGGQPVVLLHGFPQDSRSWDRLVPLLHARGFRTLAVDQRGYSPGARPRSRWAYRLSELTADIVALIDQHELGPVHVVGHDWGAAVAWTLAARRPDLVRTLTALSAPHPAAFVRALLTSSQIRKSWYMLAFQVPVLPERAFMAGGIGRRALLTSGMTDAQADRDLEPMRERSRIRRALNWYRAMPFTTPRSITAQVRVPTLYVWSDRDFGIGPVAARLTERYVTGPYTFETLPGVSHWIPEEAPEQVDALLGAHLR
ncbi:pimeloyl-ACP methyl ester carboxylesterase [Rhodococcus sp. LBL1]|uniref:Pimeloyl-ACP methyl ester carboxylesterase n=1 Tax=Prescottella agglutinans TaxID=1644129 RepID=A0ABT6MC45_9NOCA|nr:alpha/beta fold hydrolase [Prescottella agglutinans]MDH6281474.1 pimeloyl-ACP methyl ester carboxylesterase [Prescottella agglutinans]MDH6680666.1 pimeloyl-ACP methyl ester carboxylesterase [Rhodococcus sp. LBL1]MDH6686013.1 pimeloyl-ACP methyl ester carboxylesterase [Rhodococcus sp. LBL2]